MNRPHQPISKLLPFLCLFPVFAQSTIPDSPDFASTLTEILAMVKVGVVPSLDPKTGDQTGPPMPAAFTGEEWPQNLALPVAGMCHANRVMYSCRWEAKPNKYSVAVLLDSIVANVSAAVPTSFTRTKDQTIIQRYAVFSDPATGISITITCPVTDTDLVLPSYTVSLQIHPSTLRVR